jgi:hypothetical protein
MLRPCLALAIALVAAPSLAPAQDETAFDDLHYHTVKPCRLVDTRDPFNPLVTTTPVQGGSTGQRLFRIRESCGVPAAAKAVAVNLTVPTRDLQFRGHMVAYQANLSLPATSNVNVTPGTTEQNFAIVALAPPPSTYLPSPPPDMKVSLFLLDGDVPSLGGQAHLVIDVVGYFKP